MGRKLSKGIHTPEVEWLSNAKAEMVLPLSVEYDTIACTVRYLDTIIRWVNKNVSFSHLAEVFARHIYY